MVSSSEDPDSGPGTGDEAGENGRGKVDGSGQPSQPQQRSRVDRSQGEKISTERKIKITETCRETITTKGMHDLSSAINSLDDHFQIISRWTAAGPSSQLLSCGMILFSRFTPALEPRGLSRLLPSFLAGSRFRPERLQKPCTDKIFSEFGQDMACLRTPIDSVPELRSVYALSP